MKSAIVFILAAMTNSAFAGNSLGACQEYIAEAKQNLAVLEERFKVGEVTTTDTGIAKLELLDTRFECRDILFVDYCKEALPLASNVVRDIEQEALVGSRSSEQLTAAKRKLVETKHLCK